MGTQFSERRVPALELQVFTTGRELATSAERAKAPARPRSPTTPQGI